MVAHREGAMDTKTLILNYWRSWQTPADFDEMESCLARDVVMNMGAFEARSAAEFRAIVESNPAPWERVELVDSCFGEDFGTLVYEGTNTASGRRTRVAELLRVDDGRISRVTGVLTELETA